ncbi:MAG: alpha/beta fold hydrolase [Sandaracinaceae bacterium]|nr:alpha/beta fold hydrolase [Sandaracinaceae bacterium]
MQRLRPFVVPEALYPFEDQWFERDGVAMHYIDVGSSATPVVMLHGNPTWSFLYRDVIHALGPEVRCLAPDYPGFGFSDHPPGYGYTPQEHAEWVTAWLDSLALPPFILVVQDWGGPIGMSYAVEHADRIAGLVVMNTWAWPADLKGKAFSAFMGGPIGKQLCLRRNFFADKIVKSAIYYAKKKPPEVFRAYTDPFPGPRERLATWVFPRAIRESGPWLASIERRLSALSAIPAELVWGQKDQAFGDEGYIQRWLGHLGGARVTRLPKASHYLQEDQPQEIADAIRRLLEETSS